MQVRSVAPDTTPASCASLIISWIAAAISLRQPLSLVFALILAPLRKSLSASLTTVFKFAPCGGRRSWPAGGSRGPAARCSCLRRHVRLAPLLRAERQIIVHRRVERLRQAPDIGALVGHQIADEFQPAVKPSSGPLYATEPL